MDFNTRVTAARWLVLAAAAVLAVGCTSAHVARPLTAEMAGNDPDAQLAFWHTLASRPITSNNEAFHGLLLYADSEDKCAGYPQRVQLLKSHKMLPPDFNGGADEAVQRGTLAVAVARILNIKGGAFMRMTGGNSPRYAVRELMFEDVYPPASSPQQTFSGSEFLGIIGRMEDYQRGNPANAPAAVLPGEMQGEPTTQPAK